VFRFDARRYAAMTPIIGASPTFDHLAGFEFRDLHVADLDLLASRRDFSEGTDVRPGEGIG